MKSFIHMCPSPCHINILQDVPVSHHNPNIRSTGQFTAYPLNNKTYRVGFQADRNLSYGTAEEITLLKLHKPLSKTVSVILPLLMIQVMHVTRHNAKL